MRALRKARGSQLLASASVMRSTAPPSRKAGHVSSLSRHAARITDGTTLSWSPGAAHPAGGTSWFPPSLRRSMASKSRFLIPLVVPELAQLNYPYTSTTRGRTSSPQGPGTVPQSRYQGRPPPCPSRGCGPCACGAGAASRPPPPPPRPSAPAPPSARGGLAGPRVVGVRGGRVLRRRAVGREGAKYHAHTNPGHTHTSPPKPFPFKPFPPGRTRHVRPPAPERSPLGVTLPQLQRQRDARPRMACTSTSGAIAAGAAYPPPRGGRRTTRRQPSCTSSTTYSRKASTESLTRMWCGPSPCTDAPTPVWLVTTDDECTRAAGQAQLQAEWVIVQVGAGQPRPRGLPCSTALLVATGVPHHPHMAVHALEDQPEDTGHLVAHQRGGPAWLKEHVTALRFWASTISGAEIRLHDHPAISPRDTRVLSVDQLTPSHPDVRWHSANLNAGWLSPTGHYWIPEAWGHTSSDASGGGPCKHVTSVALAADLTRTWAVAILGTVPDGEKVAASLPLQYGAHQPWVHTVDAEVILHLLPQADRERTTGVPAGAAKVVNQMPLRWLRDSLCTRGRHAGHPFWYVRATSHHSDALLHKADWAASQDTILQNTPSDPGHAQLIVAGCDGHLDLRPPTMRTLGEVAQRAQTDHALTQRGHTPLGAAAATAYVHARDLTATATNRQALPAGDGHTPVQRRLRVRKERLSGVTVLQQPCLLCGGPEETRVQMHVGCAHSGLLWPHYRQAVHEVARHLPPGDKALWVASWRSAGAAWMEVFCSGLVPEDAEAQLHAIARYNPPGGTCVDDFLHHMLRLGDFA